MSFLQNLFKPKKCVLDDAGYNSPSRIKAECIESKKRIAHLTQLTLRLDEIELEAFNQYDFLRVATDSLEIAMWGKNQHGRFIFLNKACAETILHSTIESIMNMTGADFIDDPVAQKCIEADKIVMNTMKSHRFIDFIPQKSGFMWLDSTKSPWLRNGRLIGTVGSAKIITDMIPNHLKNVETVPITIEIDLNLALCAKEITEIFETHSIKNQNKEECSI